MKRLELLRYERGHELAVVAKGIGVSRQTLSRLEDGSTAKPNAKTAKALADFYGITVAELLGLDDEQVAA